MVKCGNCGIDVPDGFESCPNCGNAYIESENQNSSNKINVIRCSSCGAEIGSDNELCPSCGNKLEKEDKNLKCEKCGSVLLDKVLFCPTCGSKVSFPNKTAQIKTCLNCGNEVEEDVEFCPECGTNVNVGVKTKHESDSTSLEEKINLENIIKPSVIALIVSIILSIFGLLIGFSWFSFVMAIILAVGFFAAPIDNEVNASIFGFFVGLILGILENPIIGFMFGSFAAGFYEGYFGSHLIILLILSVVVAYVSNIYLKDNVEDIITKFKNML